MDTQELRRRRRRRRSRSRRLTMASSLQQFSFTKINNQHTDMQLQHHINVEDNFLLALPAGWFIKLAAFQIQLISLLILSLSEPFIAFYFKCKTIPTRLATGCVSIIHRIAFGLLVTAYIVAILVLVLCLAVFLGVGCVRLWVEEPVFLNQPVQFDYTQVQPNVTLLMTSVAGWRENGFPTGHRMKVAMEIVVPDSPFNQQVGVFQVYAEVASSTGSIISSSSKPCMLKFKSLPVRTVRTMVMGVPLLLGLCSESEKISIEILDYEESKTRSEIIRVKLIPRAGTTHLPQLYGANFIFKSQLPWSKELVHKWRWTLYVWVSFYTYFALLILLFCCCKPFTFSRLKNITLSKSEEGEKEAKGRTQDDVEYCDHRNVSTSLRSCEDRGKQVLWSHNDHQIVEGIGGRHESEVIDDFGDFAASESSECVGC